MPNPWDNDPIVDAPTAAQSAPWLADPIIQPDAAPWVKDPVVQANAAPALDPRITSVMAQAQPAPGNDAATMQASLQAQLNSPLTPPGSKPMAPNGVQPQPEQNGALRNFLGAAFNSASEIANPVIRGLGEVGAVDPTTAAQAIHTQLAPVQPGLSADLGNIAGGIGKAVGSGPFAPAVFAAEGAEQANETVENQMRSGQQVSNTDRLSDVTGQAALGGAMAYLFGKNAAGGAAKLIEGQLAKLAPQLIARYGARAATGYLINAGQQLASNAVTKATVNPQQDLTEGANKAGLMGAGIESIMGVVHDLSGQAEAQNEDTAPVPEPSTNLKDQPTFVPKDSETPAPENIHAAIAEQGDRLNKLQDETGDVPEEPEQPISEGVKKTLAENPPFDENSLSADEIAKRTASVDPDVKLGEDAGTTSDYFKGELDNAHGAETKYSLQDIPLDSLKLNDNYQQNAVDQYAGQPAETAPPILAGKDGAVIDGNTRARAAMARGESTIKGYAPVPEAASDNQTPFQNRTIGSAAAEEGKQWKSGVGHAWASLNRVLGTGFGIDDAEKGVRSRLVSAGSQLDSDRTVLEQNLEPARNEMDSWTPKAKAAWLDQIEQGQPSTDPKLQPVADAFREINQGLRERAEAVGMDTSRYNPNDDYIGRLAEWPEQKGGTGTSLSGPESFRKARSYDTFSEFKDAVEKSGGRLKYDNPIDMAIAKIAEVSKSVTGRELVADEQRRGTIMRIRAGQPIPENKVKLTDKLSQQEGDQYAMHPKFAKQLNDTNVPANERIAKFRELRDSGDLIPLGKRTANTGTFEEGGDLQSKQGTAQLEGASTSRKIPPGHMLVDPVLSAHADDSALYADKPIADMLNQFVAPGIGSKLPLLDKVAQATRMATAANFAMSAFHAVTSSASNAYLATQESMDNLFHGEYSNMVENLRQAVNPVRALLRGKALREQTAGMRDDPSLEPLAEAVRTSGARSGTPTILERSSWQKAVNAMRQGDPAKAGLRFTQSLAGGMTRGIMDHLVPDLKLAALRRAAETAETRGLQGEEKTTFMQRASTTTDNVAGQVVRSNQFQHRVVQNIMDMVFQAPKFGEGAVRAYGQAAVDTVQGIKDLFTGGLNANSRPTREQQIVISHLLVHGLIAAGTQAILTGASGSMQLPSSVKDLWYPRTGRKNADGTDERLSLPDPLGLIPSLMNEGVAKSITNRINPVWRAIGDLVSNSDFRGAKVRSGNAAQQVGQSVAHVASAVVPWSVQQATQSNNPNQPVPSMAQRAGAFLGVRPAPSSESRSDAENKLHELASSNVPAGGRTAEEADRSGLINALATGLRNKQPDARARIADAISSGKLQSSDRAEIMQRSQGQPGLLGDLKRSSLDAKQTVQVWDEATDDEKRAIRGVVLAKIANSKTIQPADRRTLRQHVLDDMNGMAGKQ